MQHTARSFSFEPEEHYTSKQFAKKKKNPGGETNVTISSRSRIDEVLTPPIQGIIYNIRPI